MPHVDVDRPPIDWKMMPYRVVGQISVACTSSSNEDEAESKRQTDREREKSAMSVARRNTDIERHDGKQSR
jgi:hypothetical protein